MSLIEDKFLCEEEFDGAHLACAVTNCPCNNRYWFDGWHHGKDGGIFMVVRIAGTRDQLFIGLNVSDQFVALNPAGGRLLRRARALRELVHCQ